MSHANAIWRTIAQRTCRQRRRPPPTPTTDEATTCVVEVGAPSSEAPRMTPVDARLAAQALDRMQPVDPPARWSARSTSLRASCRAVKAAAQPSCAQAGAERSSIRPVGDQQRDDHTDRLLRVVGAVTEGKRRRHRPLPAADGARQRRVARRPRGPQRTDQRQRRPAPPAPERPRARRARRRRRRGACRPDRPSGSRRGRPAIRRRRPARRRARGRSSTAGRGAR